MDIDQASFVQRDPEKTLEVTVYVAIADVASRVSKGSDLDQFAAFNTTTLYLFVETFWMFPRVLCCDETSLAPNEQRRAVVTQFNVHLKTGDIVPGSTRVFRALVTNAGKLDYETVGSYLAGGACPDSWEKELQEQLKLHCDVASALGHNRQVAGSLPFVTQKAEPVMNHETHQPVPVAPKAPVMRSNLIIEHLMISANRINVEFLLSKGFSVIRRVVRKPQRWEQIVELAHTSGYKLSKKISVKALQRFLEKRGKELSADAFKEVCLEVIILMGRGEYINDDGQGDSIGHFALGLMSYTHSTAPNRRFPDVVLQRMIFAALADEASPYSSDELSELASHMTEMEERATKLERRVTKILIAQVLQKSVGESFKVAVSQVRPEKDQVWVRVIAGDYAGVEGRLIGKHVGVRRGDQFTAKLSGLKVAKGFIDFEKSSAVAAKKKDSSDSETEKED